MIDNGKVTIIGVDVNVIDYDAAVSRIIAAARAKVAYGVSALAVHGVTTGALDPAYRVRLNALELITPDGQPVRWAMKVLHGQTLPDRVYGPTLTLKVCEAAAEEGLSIYLYGSRRAVLDAWIKKLKTMYPQLKIAGSEPSKFKHLTETENAEMLGRIRSSGADIVFVGLGCPRQEIFVYENKDELSVPLLAVGAAFDFHAGLLPQAPQWMQERGLEWAFRLYQEPKRLWRRYLYLNPLYLLLLVNQKLGVFRPRKTPGIIETQRFG